MGTNSLQDGNSDWETAKGTQHSSPASDEAVSSSHPVLSNGKTGSAIIEQGSKLSWSRLGAVFCLFSLIGILWATFVPLGGYNDEWTHARYAAAVVRGEFPVTKCDAKPFKCGDVICDGRCWISVPKSIAEIQGFRALAANPQLPDSVIVETHSGESGNTLVRNSAANYPPLYYLLVGWPTLFLNGTAAWYAMRIVSVLLCALFMTLIFAGLSSVMPWSATFLMLIWITPVTVTFFGAINPQGIEILSTGALAALIFPMGFSKKPGFSVLLTASVVLAVSVNIRTPTVIWNFIVVLMWLLLLNLDTIKSIFSLKRWWIPFLIAIGGVTFSMVWTLSTSHLVSVLGTPDSKMGFTGLLETMAQSTVIHYIPQMIGNWGWGDNFLPPLVHIIVSVLFAAVLIYSIILGSWRTRLALLLGLFSIPLTSVIIQYRMLSQSGMMWAGRYNLPVWVAIGVLSTMIIMMLSRRRHRLLAAAGLMEFGAVMSASALTAAWRYGTGTAEKFNFAALPVRHQTFFFSMLISLSLVLAFGIVQILPLRHRQHSPQLDHSMPSQDD